MAQHLRNDRHLSVHDLKRRISEFEIDTVVVAFTDMQGRLQGKRMHAAYFVDHVLEAGARRAATTCSVGRRRHEDGSVDTPCRPGTPATVTWSSPSTLETVPAAPSSAGDRPWCSATSVWLDSRPVVQSPRTDPEDPSSTLLVVLWDSGRPGWHRAGVPDLFQLLRGRLERPDYRDLTPANQYNVDYSVLGSSRVEPLLRDIRNHMHAAGMDASPLEGRVQLGASTRSASRYGGRADHRGQSMRSTRLCRQGDRRPAGHGDHVHGQIRRGRGQLLPRPPVAARRGRLDGVLD